MTYGSPPKSHPPQTGLGVGSKGGKLGKGVTSMKPTGKYIYFTERKWMSKRGAEKGTEEIAREKQTVRR